MSKKKIIAAVCAAALVLAAGVWFFLNNRTGGGSDAVFVQKVSDLTGSMAVITDRYSGVVESQESIAVKKDNARTVAEIYVQVSQVIEKDTPLFRYDTQEAENSIANTELSIEENNIRIGQLNEDIKELQKERDAAPEDAKLEYTKSIQDAEMQIKTLQLNNKNQQAQLSKYKNEVNNATVRSEAGGVIRAINENGGYDQFGNEQPFISIMETNDFRVRGKVSEQSISTISVGQNVVIRSRIDENQTWSGTIARIETDPDTENNNNYYGMPAETASSYPFYIMLASKEGLMLGQHVFIEPDYGQSTVKTGLWLDASFIAENEDGSRYVWAAENGRLKKRTVETGELDEETYTYEILSGLSEDDLITWPDESLQEGMKVTENLEMPAEGM